MSFHAHSFRYSIFKGPSVWLYIYSYLHTENPQHWPLALGRASVLDPAVPRQPREEACTRREPEIVPARSPAPRREAAAATAKTSDVPTALRPDSGRGFLEVAGAKKGDYHACAAKRAINNDPGLLVVVRNNIFAPRNVTHECRTGTRQAKGNVQRAIRSTQA